MTLKEFAERLNGTEYNGYPIFSKEDIGIAKENGFVIVTGASDDLMEFDGAIYSEGDCFDGGKVYFSKNGVEENKTQNVINALWCEAEDENGVVIPWAYETKIPHETLMSSQGESGYMQKAKPHHRQKHIAKAGL